MNTELITDYLLTIKKPMDYGTIISKLENGGYLPSLFVDTSNFNDEYEPIDAMEEVVLYALMDTYQVYHNCELYNPEGSSFHRAGQVHFNKWMAYYDMHIKDRLSAGILSRLHVFNESCKAESKLVFRRRHFQSSHQEKQLGTAIAVFDPDTRKIVKQYRYAEVIPPVCDEIGLLFSSSTFVESFLSSKAAARSAALILHLVGYACEWDLTQSNVKSRMILSENPTKPLFGYQWLPTNQIKSGNFKTKPYFWDDHLVSPTPNNIVILKEDSTAGVRQVRGFESEDAAYRDWLNEKEVSLKVDQDVTGDSISDFLVFYLDGDKSINGIVWNRVQPREDRFCTDLLKSPGKVVMEEEHVELSPKKKSEESRHA